MHWGTMARCDEVLRGFVKHRPFSEKSKKARPPPNALQSSGEARIRRTYDNKIGRETKTMRLQLFSPRSSVRQIFAER